MKMDIKYLAQAIKSRAIKFEQKARPIVIFGLRRGGTTMVSDAIAINRGVWFANEPFAVLPKHPAYELKQSLLPTMEHSHFFALTGEEKKLFCTYSIGLLNAKYSKIGTCRRTKAILRADRVCLKILNAPWMIEWFEKETDAFLLPILRHPAAQALSVLRLNWEFPVKAYFNAKNRLTEDLSDAQLRCIEEVLSSGDNWQLAILDFAVTSKKIRDCYSDSLFRYEDIVNSPIDFVDNILIERFNLHDRDLMIESFTKPSGSSRRSKKSSVMAIMKGNKEEILKAWMKEVDRDMALAGQRILDCFEVEQYNFKEAY